MLVLNLFPHVVHRHVEYDRSAFCGRPPQGLAQILNSGLGAPHLFETGARRKYQFSLCDVLQGVSVTSAVSPQINTIGIRLRTLSITGGSALANPDRG